MATRRQTAAARNRKVRVEKLNKEAFKIVDENASQIAQALLEGTKKGHVMSARLLVELAEENVGAEEALTMRPLRSLALELEAQPQWPGESSHAAVEVDVDEPSL